METLLIIMFAPLAIMLGFGVICVLLDPRVWLFGLIFAALLFIGLSLKASVVKHQAAVALPELSCESCGEWRHG
jgi:hypothetical protein